MPLPITFWTGATVFPNSNFYVFDLPHGTLPESPSATWTGPTQSTTGAPVAAAYDAAGNYYALMMNGSANPSILKYTPAGVESVFAANVPAGSTNAGNCLAIDAAGNVYFYDASNGISRYGPTGTGPTVFLTSARYLASGNLFAFAFDFAGKLIVLTIDGNTGDNCLLSISPAAAVTVLNPNVLGSAVEIGITICFDKSNDIFVLWNTTLTSGAIAKFSGTGTLVNDSFATLPGAYLWFYLAYDPTADQFFALGIDNGPANANKAIALSGTGTSLGPITSAFVLNPSAIAGPAPAPVAGPGGQPFTGRHVGFFGPGNIGGGTGA